MSDTKTVDVLADHVLKHGKVTVECRGGGSRTRHYRVTFTAKEHGGPAVVESVYTRGAHAGKVYRTLWLSTSGKPMSIAVKCAVRAGVEAALRAVGGEK